MTNGERRGDERRGGYTLVEMAIVLAIMGTVTGGILSLGSAKHEATKIELTRARMDAIEAAIRRFAFSAGYLPCPADPTALPGVSSYGVSANCGGAAPGTMDVAPAPDSGASEVWIGAIPTRSLNLPDSVMYDGWQNRFSYAVVNDLATTATSFSAYSANSSTGVIQILNSDGTQQITDTNVDTVVAYAVISYGKDKKGAITRNGTMPVTCGAAVTRDDENCDGDAIFRDSRIVDSTTAANYYDDILRWKTKAFMQPPEGTAVAACTEINYIRGGMGTIDDSGRFYTWGSNSDGQLGDGVTPIGASTTTTAVEVSGGHTDWIKATADHDTNCGIRGSGGVGTLWCWGDNANGGLGNNDAPLDSNVPVQEALNFADWSMVAKDQHACALRSGRVYCWGPNGNGQLGDNSIIQRNLPTEVDGGANTDWTFVTTGENMSCGIRNGGEAYCWGRNDVGQLGDNSTNERHVPTLVVGGVTDWTDISHESSHTCGLTATGAAYCWGSNNETQIDLAALNPQDEPYLIPVPAPYTSWSAIYAGHYTTCGITSGHLFCWGNRTDGFIPDGGTRIGQQTTPIEEVGANADWVSIDFRCGTRANGSYYCWGEGSAGENGDGTTNDTTIPVAVVHAQPSLCN